MPWRKTKLLRCAGKSYSSNHPGGRSDQYERISLWEKWKPGGAWGFSVKGHWITSSLTSCGPQDGAASQSCYLRLKRLQNSLSHSQVAMMKSPLDDSLFGACVLEFGTKGHWWSVARSLSGRGRACLESRQQRDDSEGYWIVSYAAVPTAAVEEAINGWQNLALHLSRWFMTVCFLAHQSGRPIVEDYLQAPEYSKNVSDFHWLGRPSFVWGSSGHGKKRGL